MIQNRTFSFNEECAEILLGCPAGVRQEVYDAIIRSFTSGKRTGMKPMARIIYTFIKADLERMALLFFGWIHPDYRSIVVGLLGCRELVRLEVCDAITRYIISGKQPSLKDEARIAFKPIKREIDRTKSELISAENEVGMGILSLIENKEFKSGGGHFGRDFDKEKKEKENTPHTPYKEKENKEKKKESTKEKPTDSELDSETQDKFFEQSNKVVNAPEKETPYPLPPAPVPHEDQPVAKLQTAAKFDFKKALLDLGVCEQTASDWLAVRRAVKGVNSLTAFKRIKAEIEKSGYSAEECISLAAFKSWRGFEAQWIINEKCRAAAKQGACAKPSNGSSFRNNSVDIYSDTID